MKEEDEETYSQRLRVYFLPFHGEKQWNLLSNLLMYKFKRKQNLVLPIEQFDRITFRRVNYPYQLMRNEYNQSKLLFILLDVRTITHKGRFSYCFVVVVAFWSWICCQSTIRTNKLFCSNSICVYNLLWTYWFMVMR